MIIIKKQINQKPKHKNKAVVTPGLLISTSSLLPPRYETVYDEYINF